MIKLTIATILFLAFATIAKPAQSDGVVPGTIIAIDPAVITGIYPGDSFKVNVTVSNIPADNLTMWVLTLRWNPSVLSLTEIIEGDYLKQTGSTMFTYDTLDNNQGYLKDLFCGSMEGKTGPTSGWLATFNFTAKAAGTSIIDLTSPEGAVIVGKPLWLDLGGHEFAFDTVTDGSVTVVPEFPAFLVAPIFIAITLITILAIRKTRKPKNENPNIQ